LKDHHYTKRDKLWVEVLTQIVVDTKLLEKISTRFNEIRPDQHPLPEMKIRDYRHHCGRMLFRGYLPPLTRLSIKCPKCGKVFNIQIGEDGHPEKLEGLSKTVTKSRTPKA
jgi:phage FluMu protein Com